MSSNLLDGDDNPSSMPSQTHRLPQAIPPDSIQSAGGDGYRANVNRLREQGLIASRERISKVLVIGSRPPAGEQLSLAGVDALLDESGLVEPGSEDES
jgi:hypothetical protein